MFGIKGAAAALVAGLAAVYTTDDAKNEFSRGITRAERRFQQIKERQNPAGSKVVKKAARGKLGIAVLR